jgi:transcriptional regulator with XRE-family HTH domain
VTIAKRVRDCRYAKGWGPDELASRAEISRTALYQIECGKTETPRAGTLRRIAQALEVSIDALLGNDEPRGVEVPHLTRAHAHAEPAPAMGTWVSSGREEMAPYVGLDEPRAIADRIAAQPRARSHRHVTSRDGELQRKFRELLSSPLGEGLARIVEETHRLLPDRFGK